MRPDRRFLSLSGRFAGKVKAMNESSSKPIGRTVLAALVLLVCAWLLLGFIIHFLSFVFTIVIAVAAVVAVVWALRILL
jgi:hypothetical protein